MSAMFKQLLSTALGELSVRASDIGITHIQFANSASLTENPNDVTQLGCEQLAAYFAGKLQTFDLPLTPAGTNFQQQVWQQLSKVPYGTTTSYGNIATSIGKPSAARAVGAANGKNPIAIVIPCHRVISNSGKLTGYAWGVDIKAKLLIHEKNKTSLF